MRQRRVHVFVVALTLAGGAVFAQRQRGTLMGPEGYCIDMGSSAPGSRLSLAPCFGGSSQVWTLRAGAMRGHHGVCMAVEGAAAPGARVVISRCAPQPEQRWTMSPGGQIQASGGLCVDLERVGGNVPEMASLVLQPCGQGRSQRFTWR